MSRAVSRPGQDAIARKGWLAAHKWLLLRRCSQLGILALFLVGPWFGIWIVKGNLSSSLTLDVLPLTDPFVLVQMLVAGFVPAATALVGALIVALFYVLLGGRVFCAWVCPVNMITDAAAWARRRCGIKSSRAPDARTRYWLLLGVFIAAAATGTLAWEWINPVSLAHRGLIFGMGTGLWVLVALFLFDFLVTSRGWCGHVCPMGAFYRLLGKAALLRVAAPARAACDDCMDCFAVCPEPHVIRPALKKEGQESPVISSADCTTCGRCVDVCGKQVFRLTHRFDQRSSS
ncbi:ferredoxin-type protein NapH [Betaproteobacteria bacterium]|nr:ferredoxin-type protein NapH [Betaproteobacteria bacterium]GHU02525.1 ferredoxin-type protein NapH [Betaproteobacteria bacterium]GHU09353.1 ferredoxin-type protein NapH [Betaproteobacteria bacterium]GHU20044.1 ferredoxin-type protein NapH [Betaproteobacteria bacterium]